MSRRKRLLIFALIACSGFSLNFSVSAENLEAQWEVQQIRFRYTGFSTFYTCDGIERKLRRLLILLGARDDARVEALCNNQNRVDRFHKLQLAFAMPVPADKTDISREIIPAEWQDVRIIGKLSRYLDAGDCELLDQFQRQVLPHLQVRVLKKRLYCIPNRREMNNLGLRISALKALEKTELEDGRNDVSNETSQPDK